MNTKLKKALGTTVLIATLMGGSYYFGGKDGYHTGFVAGAMGQRDHDQLYPVVKACYDLFDSYKKDGGSDSVSFQQSCDKLQKTDDSYLKG